MNRQETLTAYLEGRLSLQQRRAVAEKLATSARWRAELARLEAVQHQLQNEMPLVGRPADERLAALLPDILAASRPVSRQRAPSGPLVRRLLVAGIFILASFALPLMVVQSTISAQAAAQVLGNVPSVTTTPQAQSDSTVEARNVAAPLPDNGFAFRRGQDSFRLSASPVPMPGATVEPSLEAQPR